MPRRARVRSESGVYHIMLRGINRQKIFLNGRDKQCFLAILKQIRQQSGFELFAYCLMDNHVHLLIREQEECISDSIRKICGKYAVWYNKKYDRTGHLFQDRFRSETVESDGYFLNVLRYINQNPVKAGVCRRPEEYPFSSAKDYLCGRIGITDTYYAFRMTGEKEVCSLLRSQGEEPPVNNLSGKMTDADALRTIESLTGGKSAGQLTKMKRYQLAEIVPVLCDRGLSLHQISRVTGIGMGRIRNLRERKAE